MSECQAFPLAAWTLNPISNMNFHPLRRGLHHFSSINLRVTWLFIHRRESYNVALEPRNCNSYLVISSLRSFVIGNTLHAHVPQLFPITDNLLPGVYYLSP
jgi:hypothetical protein